MDKDEAFHIAEKFLINVYQNDMVACANIITAVADRDVETIIKAIDSVTDLCDKLKKNLT